MDSVPRGCGHLGATVPCLSLIPHHLGWDLNHGGSFDPFPPKRWMEGTRQGPPETLGPLGHPRSLLGQGLRPSPSPFYLSGSFLAFQSPAHLAWDG